MSERLHVVVVDDDPAVRRHDGTGRGGFHGRQGGGAGPLREPVPEIDKPASLQQLRGVMRFLVPLALACLAAAPCAAAEATPSHGLSVLNYDIQSRGAQAYLALAREILSRRQ